MKALSILFILLAALESNALEKKESVQITSDMIEQVIAEQQATKAEIQDLTKVSL